MRVMEVMGKTERPDSEDCKGRREESGAEEAIWSRGEERNCEGEDGGDFATGSLCLFLHVFILFPPATFFKVQH